MARDLDDDVPSRRKSTKHLMRPRSTGKEVVQTCGGILKTMGLGGPLERMGPEAKSADLTTAKLEEVQVEDTVTGHWPCRNVPKRRVTKMTK